MSVKQTKENTCCFTGHRDLDKRQIADARNKLMTLIAELYENGYRWLVCGGALGFDTLAASSVLASQSAFPDIELYLALPCKSQAQGWSRLNRGVYRRILACASKVEYISDSYTPWCMLARNRRMIELSSLCISYKLRDSGGTAYTVRAAEGASIPVLNIANS